MISRVVLVALIGCGGKAPTRAPADPCVGLADHVVSVVVGDKVGPPLLIELWRSLWVEACRQDAWSAHTHDCYRASTTIAMGDACEAAQPEAERVGFARLKHEARSYFPARERASGTRAEVQERFVVPIWGHPPAPGATFAACDAYAEQLQGLRTCAGYQDPLLDDRVKVLEDERARFGDHSPRVRGMWLGYCQAEAARRRCH